VSEDSLKESFEMLKMGPHPVVFPVVRYANPVQRARVVRDGAMVFAWPENRLCRAQDLEPHYHDAGAYYWFKTAEFKKNRDLLYGPAGFVVVSDVHSQDVDDEEDWRLLEIKYRFLKDQIPLRNET